MVFQNPLFVQLDLSFQEMLLLGLLIVLVVISVILGILGLLPSASRCTADATAPLNFAMFQAPRTSYSQQLVNLWVDKPWRSDGKRIPCRLEEWSGHNGTERSERPWVFYSHGNAEDLLHCVQFLRELSSTLEVDVVSWDYSGYGLNDPDSFERSAAGINLSWQTVFDHLVQEQGYSADRALLWGYSLGTGPTLHHAARLSPQGVVLFGAYTSIKDVVKDLTHEQVAAWFDERWNNLEAIRRVTCPILLLHGQSDGLIKYQHAERLAAQNTAHARLVLLPNTGHTQFSWDEAVHEVQKWRREVLESQ